MKVEIRGLKELIEKANSERLLAAPIRRFFNRAALTIVSRGKLQAAVDKGYMRNNIAFEVDSSEIPTWARVGCDVSNRGFPYPKALDESDRYHYRGGGALGQSGAKTRGWFSERSVKASLEDIRGYLRDAGKEIKDRWDS
jgi:hypothetical protein